MMNEKIKSVKVTHRLTNNHAALSDVFMEIDDMEGSPVAAFPSIKQAAQWLQDEGFTYVLGTNGIWSRA
jgi:peptidoglycan hydrolase-like protein with peptidoglycan-binding domain